MKINEHSLGLSELFNNWCYLYWVRILAFLFFAYRVFLTLIYLIFMRQVNQYVHPIAISHLYFQEALE